MTDHFPENLINQYKQTSSRLIKFQRTVFKRFGPNISNLSDEFALLASAFDNSNLPQFGGVCLLGSAKCEKAIGHSKSITETDTLLKAARAFVKADQKIVKFGLLSNNHEYINNALLCYNQAISRLEDELVMKAVIIREVKALNPNADINSNFISPAHRIHDLEASAIDSIQAEDYVSALEKLTEICDDITERKLEHLYTHVLGQNELTRLFLLLVLELPPSRHSPSHIKLLERCHKSGSILENRFYAETWSCPFILIQGLVEACFNNDFESIISMRDEISNTNCISKEQEFLMKKITELFKS